MDLSTPIQAIRGIGPQRAKALDKLDVRSLRDLIAYFPRRYEDRREMRPIRDLTPGESACVCAMIASAPTVHRVRKGMELVKTIVVKNRIVNLILKKQTDS